MPRYHHTWAKSGLRCSDKLQVFPFPVPELPAGLHESACMCLLLVRVTLEGTTTPLFLLFGFPPVSLSPHSPPPPCMAQLSFKFSCLSSLPPLGGWNADSRTCDWRASVSKPAAFSSDVWVLSGYSVCKGCGPEGTGHELGYHLGQEQQLVPTCLPAWCAFVGGGLCCYSPRSPHL